MAQTPLAEMSDKGYDNGSEEFGYSLFEMKKAFNSLVGVYADKREVAQAFNRVVAYLDNNFATKYGTKKLLEYLENSFLKKSDSGLKQLAAIVDQIRTFKTTVTIPTASVKTLNATPVVLVIAPGTGRHIMVIGCELLMTYNSVAYTVGATSDFSIGYETAGEIFQLETTGFMDQTSDQMRCISNNSTLIAANEAIELSVLNSELTGGDSDLKVRLEYRIIDSLT